MEIILRYLKVEENIGKPLSPYAVTKYVNEFYADVFYKDIWFSNYRLYVILMSSVNDKIRMVLMLQ